MSAKHDLKVILAECYRPDADYKFVDTNGVADLLQKGYRKRAKIGGDVLMVKLPAKKKADKKPDKPSKPTTADKKPDKPAKPTTFSGGGGGKT